MILTMPDQIPAYSDAYAHGGHVAHERGRGGFALGAQANRPGAAALYLALDTETVIKREGSGYQWGDFALEMLR
jgi:RES domain-containing protein